MSSVISDDRFHFLRDAFAGSWPKRAGLGLLLAYVLAAPFPWGSVQPGAAGTGKITLGAFLIALLAFLAPDARLRLRGAWLPIASFSGLALLALVQLAPLPRGLVRALSPLSAEAWDGAGRVLGAFGREAPPFRISLTPWETAGVALLALSFVALFLAATVLLDRRASRRLFAAAVVASGLVQVGIAIATEERVQRLHGAFVNPNNFAGYLEISLAFAFGLLWYRARAGIRDLAETTGAEERSDRLLRLVPQVVLAVVLWGVLAAGIVISQSRGGIVAAAGGTLLMGAVAYQARRGAKAGWSIATGALALLVAFGTAFAIAGAGTVAFLRFLMPDAADLAGDYRVLVWRDSIDAFRLFPWLGSGLGTFREAIRRVQSPEVTGLVDQAHNEYLQILVTGGLAGLALAATALVTGVRSLLRDLSRQQHREEGAFGLAGLGALALLLLHGAAEFNLSIPAIPATLAACLGGSWAALQWSLADEPAVPFRNRVRKSSRSSRHSHRSRTVPPSA